MISRGRHQHSFLFQRCCCHHRTHKYYFISLNPPLNRKLELTDCCTVPQKIESFHSGTTSLYGKCIRYRSSPKYWLNGQGQHLFKINRKSAISTVHQYVKATQEATNILSCWAKNKIIFMPSFKDNLSSYLTIASLRYCGAQNPNKIINQSTKPTLNRL